jgi:hypothetical protein
MMMKNVSLGLFLAAFLSGCSGASPGSTPEETADAFAELWIEQRIEARDRSLDRSKRNLDDRDGERFLWADRGVFRKGREKVEARIEFIEDNRGSYDKIEYDIADIQVHKNGNRTVVLKFWMNDEQSEGGPDSYYLMPTSTTVRLEMTQIDEEWLIIGKN